MTVHKIIVFIILAILNACVAVYAGYAENMRPVEKLLSSDPAWPSVHEWIISAKNHLEILDCDKERAKLALYHTQVTTRSPMGAVIHETGGILVGHGMIRILGSGSARMTRGVPDWNRGKSFKDFGEKPPFLLVADDIFGGFFSINGGAFRELPIGCVAYLAPRTLKWVQLTRNYSDFLNFAFNGDLKRFYDDMKWTDWDKDILAVDPNKGFHFYPPPWSKEGTDLSKVTKGLVPESEIWSFATETAAQLK